MVTFVVTRKKLGSFWRKKFFFSFPKIKIKAQSYQKSYHVNSFLIKNKIILIWSKLIFKFFLGLTGLSAPALSGGASAPTLRGKGAVYRTDPEHVRRRNKELAIALKMSSPDEKSDAKHQGV